MNFSLNEVTAMARKATRGAGYSWGMADEAGAASRWLCAQGVDGCAALSTLLEATQQMDLQAIQPEIHQDIWRGRGGPLCPIHAGAALSDRAQWLADRQSVLRFDMVMAPTMLLPFVARAARQIEAPLSIDTGTARYAVSQDALDPTAPLPTHDTSLHITISDITPRAWPTQTRATPDPDAWATLVRFAHRTYAPATEASRAKGAGGDLPDTD